MKKNKLGLVLSGGGARGLSHIGMLKVLEREHIHPAYISGTSMGAILGAAYASGMSVDALEKVALEITQTRNMVKMVHLSQPFKGLIDIDKLKAFLSTMIPEYMEFSQLRIPLAVCATDLLTGKAISIREGKVLSAILASSALPGIFQPVEIGPYKLVDGGVLNNMPVDLAYQLGAQKVVAIDVQQRTQSSFIQMMEPAKPKQPLAVPDQIQDMLRSEVIMASRITEINLQIYPPDLMVEMPVSIEITSISGYNRAAEIIQVGVETTEKYLPQIRALLE